MIGSFEGEGMEDLGEAALPWLLTSGGRASKMEQAKWNKQNEQAKFQSQCSECRAAFHSYLLHLLPLLLQAEEGTLLVKCHSLYHGGMKGI